MVTQTAHFPAPDEIIPGGQVPLLADQKLTSQAVATSLTGSHLPFMIKVWGDPVSRMAVDALRQKRIRTRHITIVKRHASGAEPITDSENTIVVMQRIQAGIFRHGIRSTQ